MLCQTDPSTDGWPDSVGTALLRLRPKLVSAAMVLALSRCKLISRAPWATLVGFIIVGACDAFTFPLAIP